MIGIVRLMEWRKYCEMCRYELSNVLEAPSYDIIRRVFCDLNDYGIYVDAYLITAPERIISCGLI